VPPQCDPGLEREYCQNISKFNQMVKDGPCGMKLIPWIDQARFHIQQGDPYKIHWTQSTANDLLDHWLVNIGLLN